MKSEDVRERRRTDYDQGLDSTVTTKTKPRGVRRPRSVKAP